MECPFSRRPAYMSITPTKAAESPSIDSAPYYENAANAAKAGIQRRQQISNIDQANCAWGRLYLRRVARDSDPKSNQPDMFVLVIQNTKAEELNTFEIDASIVGEAIASGTSALFYILKKAPAALAEVAKLDSAVGSVMEALALAQASPKPLKSQGKKIAGPL